jgi:hypothetical protein
VKTEDHCEGSKKSLAAAVQVAAVTKTASPVNPIIQTATALEQGRSTEVERPFCCQ